MPKNDLVASLDLGSHRVTCLIAHRDADTGRIHVLGHSSVPCMGLKGGVVVSITETARAIARAVEEAEGKSQATVSEVVLGVCGGHLQSFNNSGRYNVARSDKQITAEDITHVVDNAKAIHISNDRVLLHVLPQTFSLDHQRGVPNPVGMEGSYLETEVHIVTASQSHLKNLIKAVNDAGFEVIEPVYSLLAVGDLVVSAEEKELGCLLIDLGGQNVSLAVYADGSIRFSKEIELGSDFITRDLAYGLKTTMGTARHIKERYGAALTTSLNGDSETEVSYVGIDGRTSQTVKAKTLVGFIAPRIEEIFEKVREEIEKTGYEMMLPGGAILTGGGSLLRGMPEAVGQILEMPVRLGLPQGEFSQESERFLTPEFAPALALLRYAPAETAPSSGFLRRRRAGGMLRRLATWFEEAF